MRTKGFLTALLVLFFSTSLFAEPTLSMLGDIQFGDSKKTVEEKVKKLFELKAFRTFHEYKIGEGKYRLWFSYNAGTGGLEKIKIYSSNIEPMMFRSRIPSLWQGLDGWATQHYGEGFGSMPHRSDIKEKSAVFAKDWIRKTFRADLGVIYDLYGYHVELVISPVSNPAP